MKHSYKLVSCALLLIVLVLPFSLLADTSHIRIVRLSLVQGDVRFTQSFHKDPMTDSSAVWERAPLNLPIRQGYALSTDEGRAEVEFESGAMAFLNAHSVLEFYDLSLEDGSRITRLVLRQGTGIFYVNPAAEEYFSVTGGDFTVEANGRTEFRLDNFDDGSTVQVEKGHVSALLSNKPTPLEKGQSYTVHASNPKNPEIARLSDNDDFDSWVSGRIDNVVTATNYSSLYMNSPNYTSGFSDLYTYGNWYSLGGFGYGWRPFGAAFGWSPFTYGDWFDDPSFGWSFIGSAPWGWLPYHYGGWVFSPSYGWVWAPSGFGGGGGPVAYRPVTAVFVHSGSTFGYVPAHPADAHGKTPININQGVYSTEARGTMVAAPAAGEKWSVVKHAPVTALSGANFAAAPLPARVVRTLPAATTSNRSEATSGGSSIAYDPSSHRFVNSNAERAGSASMRRSEVATVPGRSGSPAAAASPSAKGIPSARTSSVGRPALTPPPARTASGGFGGARSSNAPAWGAASPSVSMGTATRSSSSSTSSSGTHSSGGSHR